MTTLKKIFCSFIVIAASGCNTPVTEKKADDTSQQAPAAASPADIKNTIKEEQLAMKKDPVCGMVVYKYLEDTTLYNGKIYGFCGKGCKDDFLKKPADYVH